MQKVCCQMFVCNIIIQFSELLFTDLDNPEVHSDKPCTQLLLTGSSSSEDNTFFLWIHGDKSSTYKGWLGHKQDLDNWQIQGTFVNYAISPQCHQVRALTILQRFLSFPIGVPLLSEGRHVVCGAQQPRSEMSRSGLGQPILRNAGGLTCIHIQRKKIC